MMVLNVCISSSLGRPKSAFVPVYDLLIMGDHTFLPRLSQIDSDNMPVVGLGRICKTTRIIMIQTVH